MACHAGISIATAIPACFCDPRALAARLGREHQRAAASPGICLDESIVADRW